MEILNNEIKTLPLSESQDDDLNSSEGEEIINKTNITKKRVSNDLCIEKLEKFDIDMLRFLIQTPDTISSSDALILKYINKNKFVDKDNHIKYRSTYRLGKNSDFSDVNNILKVGRWCASRGKGLQCLSREVRAALSHKFYFDVDIVNAQPTMLLQMCKSRGLICENLEFLCEKREELFKSFALNNPQHDRDHCKTEILRLIFGGKPSSETPDWIATKFYPELKNIMEDIAQSNPKIFEGSKKLNPKNPKGSCLALILQTDERNCLMALDHFMQTKGRYMGVLIHDGGLVEKKLNETEFPEDLLREAEIYIQKSTGYKIRLTCKPLNSNYNIPNKQELDQLATYDAMKYEFEKSNFKCAEYYYNIDKDETEGSEDNEHELIKVMTEQSLTISNRHLKYEDMDKNGNIVKASFIAKWKEDENIRIYKRVQLVFPPKQCPKTVYNLWKGFYIQDKSLPNIVSQSDKDDFEFILNDFFRMLFGNECYDYVMNWVAMLFQRPAEKPGVCILLRAQQGLGKGFFYEILKAMIGEDYTKLTENPTEHVFGKFNNVIKHKLLVLMDEMNYAISKTLEDRIKGYITCDSIIVNEKGINNYSTPDYSHLLVFCNKDFPWKLEDGDRRTLAIDRFHVPVQNWEYYGRVKAIFYPTKNNVVLRMLYNYFISIDVRKFIPKDRPNTEFSKELKEISRDLELQFLIDYIQTCEKDVIVLTSQEMYSKFKDYLYINTASIKYKSTSQKCTTRISKYGIQGIIKSRQSSGYVFTINISEAKKWVDEHYS